MFPLFFLAFMIPLPEIVVDSLEEASKQASAEVASWLFLISGTPFLRTGTMFQLPGITITVAKECSGIRSSLSFDDHQLAGGKHVPPCNVATSAVGGSSDSVRSFAKCAAHFSDLAALRAHRSSNDQQRHSSSWWSVFFVASLIPLFVLLWWLRRREVAAQQRRAPDEFEIDSCRCPDRLI